MNDQYLTISESAQLTGRSIATIRRLINQMNNQNDQLINQMIKREGSGNKAKILIKRVFLEQEFGLRRDEPTKEQAAPVASMNDNIVEVLREQLAIKDGQLAVKDRQIETLSGQISDLIKSKEHSDILLKNMQEALLALPQPQPQEIEPEPSRRTIWSRIFGR